tara:strand:+ start:4645 stop:6720 length:2076 start_codon:yes stop_codon:yes gene_type:complete
MKTVSRINEVTRSGVKKVTQCGMVVNAKAFDMLARQYSDPIKAILQELGANAADSHVRVGKEAVPFSVKLPNTLDPHLRIRDYGVGMSEEVIYDVYINYMKSDKTETNSETGCFGIGSKTPLAYADQFNITTYNDGVMTMYALVKNEEGVPELNEFGSWDTDEDTGVEISFAVKEDDFEKFSERAVKVFSYFKNRPDVSGNGSFEFKDLGEAILEGNTWSVSKGYADSYVVMGNVAYPIDEYQFEYGSQHRKFLNNSVVMEVPIGSLNVTPSRESLEYSEHTIEGIKNAVDIVLNEINDVVIEKFKDCNSWWSAKSICKKIKDSVSGLGNLPCLSDFNGRSLSTNPDLYIKRSFRQNGSKVSASNTQRKQRVETREDVRVVVLDTKSKFDKNCRYLVSEEDVLVYLVELQDCQTYAEIKEELGVCDADGVLCLSSELTEAPKMATSRTGSTGYARKKTLTVREFTPNNTGYSSSRYESRYWSESEVDLNDDTQNRLYVSWFNYDTSLQNGEDIDIRQLRGELMAVGIEMPELYGMKPNQIKRVAKKDNWMSVEEWAKMAFEVYLDENDVKEILQLNSSLKCTDWILPLVQMLGNSKVSVNEDTLLGNLLNKVGSEKSSKNAGKILAIAKRLKYNVDNDDDSIGEEVKELAKQCEERYIFLMDWISRTYVQNTDAIAASNLIKMIEAFDLCN